MLPRARELGVRVVTVGLGSPENARGFARTLNSQLADLYADPAGAAYEKLGYSPGFAPDVDISPYAKLLPMLAGIGSPGTMQEARVAAVRHRAALLHLCAQHHHSVCRTAGCNVCCAPCLGLWRGAS